MRIRDLMHINIALLEPNTTFKQAAVLLKEIDTEGAPVVDEEGRLLGLLGKSQVINALLEDRGDNTITDAIRKEVFAVTDDVLLYDLTHKSKIYNQHYIPVVNCHGHPVGYVTPRDLLHYWPKVSMFLAEEMKAILRSVYNGVIATNADGVVTLFNKAAEQITGLRAETVIGQPVDDVIPNTRLKYVLATGLAELNQKQYIDKCQILTNRTPIYQDNKIIGSVAIFQDITQLEEVAAELENVKSLKSTLESIMDTIFDCIIVVDKHGVISMMNQAYCELLGVTPEQVIGRHVTEILENSRMHIVAQSGKAEICDLWRVRGQDCVVTRKPIIKDGEVVGAVAKIVFRDVKDLKLLAKKFSTLQSELEYYQEELRKVQGGTHTIESIIGNSERMKWLKTIALKAAKGTSTVLIQGESGTGKEVFAQAIHSASARSHGPFIKINCAALPENLLESELFGYEEGAFSGARKGGKPGKFELAHSGTIFLDEIGDMSLAMQAKLLRVLQEKEVDRIGGTKTTRVDVRVLAATNRDIEDMVEKGLFRQDLYYRLNIVTLYIPPLRERKEDIPLIAKNLLNKVNCRVQHFVEGITSDAMKLMMGYDWPGNVRELENVLERAVNLIDDETYIHTEHLPPTIKKLCTQYKEPAENPKHLAGIVADTEKQAIYRALETAGGNKSKAAKILGIQRSAFYQKLQKYGL
jgi:PAS domain S-box-containing protein